MVSSAAVVDDGRWPKSVTSYSLAIPYWLMHEDLILDIPCQMVSVELSYFADAGCVTRSLNAIDVTLQQCTAFPAFQRDRWVSQYGRSSCLGISKGREAEMHSRAAAPHACHKSI